MRRLTWRAESRPREARLRMIWLAGGAVAMGLGIWSMHYIGMLAFNLPLPVEYDWPTVLVSLIAAILASAVALYVVSRKTMRVWNAVLGSLVMGTGIAAMHYIGMEAMRMSAMCHYSIPIVALSVVLAIVISLVALWLVFLSRDQAKAVGWRKIASALVMGAAIPVMHYTGMAAASLHENGCAARPIARGEHFRAWHCGHHDGDADRSGSGDRHISGRPAVFRASVAACLDGTTLPASFREEPGGSLPDHNGRTHPRLQRCVRADPRIRLTRRTSSECRGLLRIQAPDDLSQFIVPPAHGKKPHEF